MNKKQRIRINESKLSRIVAESVKKLLKEEVGGEKCICEQLRKEPNSIVSLEYDCYTELKMGNGWIAAYGEGRAMTDIQYCPFCGKKFE